MRRKFTITIYQSTREEQKQLADYLQKNSFGWWKYFEEMWIIVTPANSSYSASQIRNEIKGFFPKKRFLILDLGTTPLNWSGVGREKNFNWFRKLDNL